MFLPVVNFPDFDASKYTFSGLNKFSSTIGPNLPLGSFKTRKSGDSNCPVADISGFIV